MLEQSNTILGKSLQNDSIVTRIVDQITQAIINGELHPGDKLPTEISLCSTFGVGRNSVREAIKILEAYGVVYIKRADGTFINDSYSQKMLDPMLYGILLQKKSFAEIMQLRKVLDIGIMQTMIPSIAADNLTLINNSFKTLSEAITQRNPNCREVLQADIDFHMAITQAANNDLLLSMYSYVDRITIPSRTDAIEFILNSGKAENFIHLHQKLINIIVQKKFHEIEETITEHYMFWKQAKEVSHA